MVFDAGQANEILRRTGPCDLVGLACAVRSCGFDEVQYLRANADLQRAGFDPAAALVHYLVHGCGERRDPVCGAFPGGLQELAGVAVPDRAYATQLFRGLFFGQLRNERSSEALWKGLDPSLIDLIRQHGGIPYFIVGDSHSNLYMREGWLGEKWLAPLLMICHGGSAVGLANPNSTSRYGTRILQWASTATRIFPGFDVPVFLKFGGIDSEFLWISRRVSEQNYRYTYDQFDEWARRSLAQYDRFLGMLSELLDPSLLNVCSVLPAVLADPGYIEGFVAAHKGSAESDLRLAAELRKLEIPDLTTRTALRAHYNAQLRAMCEKRRLSFADDFSPFLDASGVVAPVFWGAHQGRDHHLDYDASEPVIMRLIRDAVT